MLAINFNHFDQERNCMYDATAVTRFV